MRLEGRLRAAARKLARAQRARAGGRGRGRAGAGASCAYVSLRGARTCVCVSQPVRERACPAAALAQTSTLRGAPCLQNCPRNLPCVLGDLPILLNVNRRRGAASKHLYPFLPFSTNFPIPNKFHVAIYTSSLVSTLFILDKHLNHHPCYVTSDTHAHIFPLV